jgi:hypothetical protein
VHGWALPAMPMQRLQLKEQQPISADERESVTILS